MGSMNYDGRTLSIDGKRIWIVSGSIHFQRTPRTEWKARILAAKQAGLNTIETPVFWNLIEPRPGSYNFKEDNDLRHFIELIGEAGMHCILRPGPYIGSGWDLGGLPAWLLNIPEMELRQPNQPFLEAVGKYFNAIAKQVKDLQGSTSGGGPIILVQNESQWTCDEPLMATKYLGELGRYLREAGFTVPKTNSNNLWAGVEGDIDAWTGEGEMFAIMRQLGAVRPDQPKLIIDYGTKQPPRFGAENAEPVDPYQLQRQLAEIMVGGGQFNIGNFSSGTNFGFWGGQRVEGEHPCSTPTQDTGAMLDEHGRPTALYGPARRLMLFASTFGRVFANAETEHPAVVIDPSPEADAIQGHVVTHVRGSHGSVAFVFSPPKTKPGTVNLLLPDGSLLPVRLGHQRVHWCLFDVNLSNRNHLDYSSLNALCAADDLLVVFGPGGGHGTISINGTPLELEVPKGRKPLVERHEDVTVVVVCDEMADETFLHGSEVFVGVHAVNAAGDPIPSPNGKTHTHVSAGGKTRTSTTKPVEGDPGEKLERVSIGGWECAVPSEHIDGSSPRYAQIPGPADLSELGTPYGYGWYRIGVKPSSAGKIKIGAPELADRAQLFIDGEPVGVLGSGPGAESVIEVSMSKDDHQLVAIADNMGRVDGGSDMSAKRGLYGHLIEAAPFKVAKGKVEQGAPIDVLSVRSPVFGVRVGDTTHPDRVAWSFKHLKKSAIIVDLPAVPVRCVVVLNEENIGFYDAGRPIRLVLDNDATKRGNNDLQIAMHTELGEGPDIDEMIQSIAKGMIADVTFTEAMSEITDGCTWSFAKWEAPAEVDFDSVPKGKFPKHKVPAWWKSSFDGPKHRVALSVDTTGLSKGQVFINGNALGRYFVQTGAGKTVPPAMPLAIPASWIKESGNELMIFDEHGNSPSKVKIIVERA